MAGLPRVAGYPDYSSSGLIGYTPEIWSGKMVSN